MRVISHGLKEKCWNNTFHERFQAHWSAMHIENPQPGITLQIDPPPAKKKKRKEHAPGGLTLRRDIDIPSKCF